jgi:hypothetical protein
VFATLADVGVDAEAVVYEDHVRDAARTQLATVDGVLVWVNPIHEGRNRVNLDELLREVAERGVWVSAHPDVILKMPAGATRRAVVACNRCYTPTL